MYFIRWLICIFLFVPYFAETQAQITGTPPPLTNFRQKSIPITSGVKVQIDSLSIIPGSFSIVGIDSGTYTLDAVNAVLYWAQKPSIQEVVATYRVFPVKLNSSWQRMNFDSLLMNSAAPIPVPIAEKQSDRNLFNFGNINAQGSFGRQIGFGNNQSAVLNSNMNIQLSGYLADSIELQAAITDNNIPIQPDGNTQQLNEFDEVYIRFKKQNWQLNIGDLDIRENRSYFLNFYKRLQGMSFQTTNNISKKTKSNTLVSGSIAKGKFTRNVFNGAEGNQGPYRLTGANNETFFIVLANTERVFIDGELLQRGEDQDYVINYNTAELTFTPRRMITKDSRIQIEFEYADRNFLNTNLFASQELDFNNKVKLRVGYFNNSDAKNSSINQVLDSRQKQFLYQLGDSIQNAYYPSAELDTLAAGKILYEKIVDSVGGVAVDSFYQYSTDQQKTLYNLAFTETGFGKGNYIPDANNANGKVFTYVAPVNGIKQGNFEPVMILITPKNQQVMNLGVDYNINKNILLKTEVAASSYDVNTFSPVNNGDDKGFAAKVNLSHTGLLKAENNLQLISAIDYEYVQQKFQPLERLRNVEFTRDWGLPLITPKADESILKLSTGLKNKTGNTLQYKFTNYNRSDNYNGFQNALTQHTLWKNWAFNNEFVLTNYKGSIDKGYFLRPIIDISKKLPWLDDWHIGARYTLEENNNRNATTDTLNYTAFSFDTYTFFLKSDESKTNRYGISFYTRSDKYPVNKQFIRGDRSYNLNLQTAILSNSKRQFSLNATFRKLKVYDTLVSRQQEDNTVLGRIEYMMNEFNGFINGNILYEAGSGQEQKREYAYLEVPPGTGQYVWIDYNEDGIQQLNEFEVAAFQDQAKFIRIFTPSNEYIKASYVTLNYSFNITPKMLWNEKEASATQKFFSRMNLLTSLQINKKAISQGAFEINPFNYTLLDNNLIALNTVIANTFSFNRQSTVWGFDISNLRNNGKSLLTYGYESRRSADWTLKYRHFLSKSVTVTLNAVSGLQALYTGNNQFENQNYEIKRKSAEPGISYIRGTNFRVSGSYKYEKKQNAHQYGGQQASSHALMAETRYNLLQSASVTGKFTFENFKYDAANQSQTTVSYIMLNGLMPGKNYLWNIMLTKRLMNNLELNFQYDGRKPGTGKTIHTGKATLTAIF
ncbi:MAG: hypothetical protein ACK5NK_16755 [Niabella sp.]